MSRPAGQQGGGFAPAAMIAIIAAGVLALTAMILLAAYGPRLNRGDDGGAHALSRSAIGYGALAALLKETGRPVVISRGVLDPETTDGLLILTPPYGARGEATGGIEHFGPRLLVLPKWSAEPAERSGWVRLGGALAPDGITRLLPPSAKGGLTLRRDETRGVVQLRRPSGGPLGPPLSINRLQTFQSLEWQPVVTDAQGRAVLVMHKSQWLYVLSDPDLLNTHGLASLNGARAAIDIIDLIQPANEPVIFDVTLNGLGLSRNLWRLALEPPLAGLTIVLAAVLGAVGWHVSTRFGRSRDDDALTGGKWILADNTAGLVRLARREHRMGAPYAALIRDQAARAIGAPASWDVERLEDFLDRVAQTKGAGPYSALAEQAAAASSRENLVQIADELHKWRQEMSRGR